MSTGGVVVRNEVLTVHVGVLTVGLLAVGFWGCVLGLRCWVFCWIWGYWVWECWEWEYGGGGGGSHDGSAGGGVLGVWLLATNAEGRIAEGVSAGGGVLQVGVLGWDRSSGGEGKGVGDGGAGVGVLTVGVQVVRSVCCGSGSHSQHSHHSTTITNRTPTLTPSIPTLKHSPSLHSHLLYYLHNQQHHN